MIFAFLKNIDFYFNFMVSVATVAVKQKTI